MKQLLPINLTDAGQVKRVRGIAYTTRLNPSFATRMVDTAKGILTPYVADVFVYTDHYKGTSPLSSFPPSLPHLPSGNDSGSSPGFGISLVAESTTGCLVASEVMAPTQTLPEDVAQQAAALLVEEVLMAGCIDTPNQGIMLALMALGPEDVTKLRTGKLSDYTIEFLRHIRDFLGVTFQLLPDPATGTVLIQGFGSGFVNLARSTI